MDIKTCIAQFLPRCEQEKADQKLAIQLTSDAPDTILTRKNTIAHFTSSAFILNESLEKLLMVHHLIYRTWSWTGGHADGESNLLAVAQKEAREETGIETLRPLTNQMDSFDVLPVYGHWKNGSYVGTHLHLSAAYLFIASEQEGLRMKEDENDGVRWIARQEVARYSQEPYLIAIYEKLWKRAEAYGG